MDPKTGWPTADFMRQFAVAKQFNGQLSDLLAVDLIAGVALSGGGSLGSLTDLTFNLEDTAVAPGTYGDASNVAQFTVDQQGRITSASSVAISAVGLTHSQVMSRVSAGF